MRMEGRLQERPLKLGQLAKITRRAKSCRFVNRPATDAVQALRHRERQPLRQLGAELLRTASYILGPHPLAQPAAFGE